MEHLFLIRRSSMTVTKNIFRVLAASTALSIATFSAPTLAQSTMGPQKREPSFSVTLNQDSFFGFYPAFSGAMPVNDTMDFTFYGILWTKPAFGLGLVNQGDDLWTEFGAGVNFNLLEGNLTINPQIGVTNGALLSGGALNAAGETTGSRFADGIVPSLTVNYGDDSFEAQLYAGYYAALRQRNGDAALDFLHTWVNAGCKFSSLVSAGAHYELLSNRSYSPGSLNQPSSTLPVCVMAV
jgi:hypothetical protein